MFNQEIANQPVPQFPENPVTFKPLGCEIKLVQLPELTKKHNNVERVLPEVANELKRSGG